MRYLIVIQTHNGQPDIVRFIEAENIIGAINQLIDNNIAFGYQDIKSIIRLEM